MIFLLAFAQYVSIMPQKCLHSRLGLWSRITRSTSPPDRGVPPSTLNNEVAAHSDVVFDFKVGREEPNLCAVLIGLVPHVRPNNSLPISLVYACPE